MKRIFTLIIIVFIFTGKFQAQTMFGNTALTLNKGVVSLGVNANYATNLNLLTNSEFVLPENLAYFLHFGYGTSSSTDLGVNIGKAWGKMYYGIDFEKSLIKKAKLYVSGTLGAHYWNYAGVDADIIASVKINDFYLTSGIDVDIEVHKLNEGTLVVYLPAYVPVTIEFNPNNKMAYTLEANIAINNRAFTTVGAGLNFYFK